MASKTVVITGVSSGIGFDAARFALARGAHVFGSVRSQTSGEQAQSTLDQHARQTNTTGARGLFTPVVMDVTRAETVHAAAQFVRERLNGAPLDGLVNNAGVAIAGPLLHQPLDEWRAVIETNLIGVMSVTQAFGPLLGTSAQGRAGRIVNISSVSGKTGWPMLSAYAASKHGLEGLSESLRRELHRYGIRVIVIGPGAIRTPIWDKARAHDVSPYVKTDYAHAFNRYGEFVNQMEAGGLPVEKISALIWHALTAARPRRRYAPAPDPISNALVGLLPAWLTDRIAIRMLGLD
jgi:NAD(P)-dependent dehydrogenase (short-subunit alcohol dehydrogenase family)